MPEPPTEHPHATALRWACKSLEDGAKPETIEETLRQRLPVPAAGSALQERVPAALADYEAQKTGEIEPDGQIALSLIARALGAQAPVLRPASTWKDASPPEQILWRHYHEHERDLSPVLSVGEVCLLSAAGGLGKSTVTVAVAAAAATAEDVDYGAACGLRVRSGPVVLLSYEDSPPRVMDRLKWYDIGPAADRVHLVEDPVPLWEAPPGRGAGERCAAWPALWEAIRATGARLVVIDPASAACLTPVAEAPAVRAFLSACMAEAQPRDGWTGCGVLIVAHSTKAARDTLQQGADPGAGVVAGSSAWWDAARGVLTLYRGINGRLPAPLREVQLRTGRMGPAAALRGALAGPASGRRRGRAPGRRGRVDERVPPEAEEAELKFEEGRRQASEGERRRRRGRPDPGGEGPPPDDDAPDRLDVGPHGVGDHRGPGATRLDGGRALGRAGEPNGRGAGRMGTGGPGGGQAGGRGPAAAAGLVDPLHPYARHLRRDATTAVVVVLLPPSRRRTRRHRFPSRFPRLQKPRGPVRRRLPGPKTAASWWTAADRYPACISSGVASGLTSGLAGRRFRLRTP